MTKIPCEVIKDLLPLYHDDICSEKSRVIVEEHLGGCESCRAYLKKMECEIPVEPDQTEEEWKGFRAFSKKVSRKLNTRMVLAGGAVFVICMLLMMILLSGIFRSYHLSRIDAEDIKVAERYQLKDGSVYIHLKSRRRITGLTYPQEALDAGKYEVSMDSSRNPFSRWMHITAKEAAYIIPSEDGQMIAESGAKITELDYTGRSGDSKILWQEHDKVKQAPAKVEKFVKESLEKEEDDPVDEKTAKVIWVNPKMPLQ